MPDAAVSNGTRARDRLLPAEDRDALEHARTLARLLDSAIRIPGTNMRIGLDPILGLVPGLGDVAGAAFAGYLVLVAARTGVSRAVLVRMLLNVALDTFVGAVPVAGDLFDAAWRSNSRNVALLERYLDDPRRVRTSSRALVVAVLATLALVAAGGVALAVLVFRSLGDFLGV
jgi:hypothetical protein